MRLYLRHNSDVHNLHVKILGVEFNWGVPVHYTYKHNNKCNDGCLGTIRCLESFKALYGVTLHYGQKRNLTIGITRAS